MFDQPFTINQSCLNQNRSENPTATRTAKSGNIHRSITATRKIDYVGHSLIRFGYNGPSDAGRF